MSALNRVEGVSQDKPVWVTEVGWPVSGPTENQAVASAENSKTYWDEVGCELFNQYNVWWYILRDNNASPAPDPSFGIVGIELEEPLFDLTCPAGSSGASTPALSATNGTLIANGTESANTTTQRTNQYAANQLTNTTSASNPSNSSASDTTHPSPDRSHSNAAIFSSNMPESSLPTRRSSRSSRPCWPPTRT